MFIAKGEEPFDSSNFSYQERTPSNLGLRFEATLYSTKSRHAVQGD